MAGRDKDGLTPMMRQYRRVKAAYPNTLILFRLGDFYETFEDDARVAARELDIVLTSRGTDPDGQPIPLAGIPYHALDNYLARLIKRGLKVAICEQVEDPKLAKGLVKREVVRVVTPGTVTEEGLLKEDENNYLMGLASDGDLLGVAVADISTGAFRVTEWPMSSAPQLLRDELIKTVPSECILSPDLERNRGIRRSLNVVPDIFVSQYIDWEENLADPLSYLDRTLTLHEDVRFRLAQSRPAALAAAGVMRYVKAALMTSVDHLNGLEWGEQSKVMNLDAATQTNLELVRSIREGGKKATLLWVLDKTVTAQGARLLRHWILNPMVDVGAIAGRQDRVECFFNDGILRSDVRTIMQDVRDLERLVAKVVFGSVHARDLLLMSRSLAVLPDLRKMLGSTDVGHLLEPVKDFSGLCGELERAIREDAPVTIKEGGIFKQGYDAQLDELLEAASSAKCYLAGLESRERERTGIKSLKVGFNKVFGYYLEVTRANLDKVPEDYIRKQTLVSSERFFTEELKNKESLILGNAEKVNRLEYQLFASLREKVEAEAVEIQRAARVLAELDVYVSLAEVAVRNGYVRPVVSTGLNLEIIEGRHPVVELMLTDEHFVPNDTLLDVEDSQISIITGPNMAGKSTYIRQTALIVLMAQMGCFVPCKKASIGMVDRVFTRIGASDSVARGLSTFMVEMMETAHILRNATGRSLVVLDEIGRGTSTFDGLSIAWAVVEYLHSRSTVGAKTLFATHYHELTELAKILSRINNYNISVRKQGEDIVFLRRIVPGGVSHSFGIEVARLAGIPEKVIERAQEVLKDLESVNILPGFDGGMPGGIPVEQESSPPGKETGNEQLRLFEMEEHPAVTQLREMSILEMSPLEAINRLYELQCLVRGKEAGKTQPAAGTRRTRARFQEKDDDTTPRLFEP